MQGGPTNVWQRQAVRTFHRRLLDPVGFQPLLWLFDDWQAIAPSKANVQAVAIRGAGPADKITVQGLDRLDSELTLAETILLRHTETL